jgi:C4-dicarboxylate-binding protein DctP
MKKFSILIMVLVMVGTMFTACGSDDDEKSTDNGNTGSETGSTENTDDNEWGNYELKLATNLADDHIATAAYKKFADEVDKATDGHVKIIVFPGEQLGKESDVTNAISMNSGDMVVIGPGEMTKYLPTLSFFDAPYVFDNGQMMTAFANSEEAMPLWDQMAEESNLRLLSMIYYGTRQITNNGYAATIPEEMNGCKLRVPDTEIAIQYGKGLGASPTPMSFGEVYMSLQQGVIDGQENPLTTIKSSAFYEVQENLVLSGHVVAAVGYIINEETWQSMPEDLQAIIMEEALKSSEELSQTIADQEADLVKEMEEMGMNIVEPDREAFKESCSSIYEDYADIWGDWLDVINTFAE